MRHRCTTGLSAALLPVIVAAAAVRAEAQTKAYVTQAGANVVPVIDTATATTVGTVPVAGGPGHVAVTADGARAYITDGAAASVSVVDTASDTVLATVPVGAQPSAVAVTPDGSL